MRDEMRERGLTQRQLASLAGLTPSMVSALVNARCNVTEDIAAALEKALGIPVVMWMNLQSQYDHDLAEQANSARMWSSPSPSATENCSAIFPASSVGLV